MTQVRLKEPLKWETVKDARTHTQKKNINRRFIMWDGEETRDAGYCLFGNSVGFEICSPHISSEEMLDLIIRTGKAYPQAFHVAYVFYYDVNHILKDIGKLRIAILHKTGKVSWKGYRIEYIPHKIFTVSKADMDTGKVVKVRIDDVFSFFRKRFDEALKKFDIGDSDEVERITKGKDGRDDFWWEDIDEIRQYWRLELKYGVQLMDRLRKDINSAGIFIGQWHGPGALASHALREHEMGKFMKPTPDEMIDAVLHAYSAGWFERYTAGVHDGKVYTADINSAYVYAISLLPDLSSGTWEYVSKPESVLASRTRFGLFHIRLIGNAADYFRSCHGVPLPLFLREKRGNISHPIAVDGWYWGPEAALVANHPKVQFLEAWIYHDDGTYPFSWVADIYQERLVMQHNDNVAEKVLKWLLASLYGRLAQRVGWDEKTGKPPPWHQLEWAGFITSMCRSMIYRAAIDVAFRNGLVSIDTDGIISTVPFNESTLTNGVGEGLGEWKIEEFEGMIYIQNGIYWLKGSDGEWVEPKLRGIPKSQVKDESLALAALESAFEDVENAGKITLTKKQFIGYGQALHSNWNDWLKWKVRPHVIDVNNSGKRRHVKALCRACKYGYKMTECLHDLALVPSKEIESCPHTVPWMNAEEKESAWDIMKHYVNSEDG